jgi:ABC-type branched-subunit amino acid transport system substrate-binding protein
MMRADVPALLLLLAAAPPGVWSGELAPAEVRGKQIYTQGTSASGVEIKAALGDDGNEVPASALPCAGCHGLDGHGGKEGGVRPSDLTPEALARSIAVEAGGRRHPPYDDRLLVRAIAMGLDPAGNRLHVAMPRYRLTRQDAADLLAYLKRLGHEEQPGLSATAVHLGVLLPGGNRQETEAEAVKAALTARCAELNRDGGLYGRQLVLHFAWLPESLPAREPKLQELLGGAPVFALIATHLEGEEDEIAAAAEAAGTPLISALSSRPREAFPLNRYAFHLTPGLAEQAKALVKFAALRLPQRGRLAIVRPGTREMTDLAAGVETAAREHGFTAVEPVAAETLAAQAAVQAGRLARQGTAALLLLASGSATRELLRQAQDLGWHPLVLMPASLLGAFSGEGSLTVPAFLGDRLFVSLPVLPADWTSGAADGYRRLAAVSTLPTHHIAAQRAGLAAVDVLIEGLKRAGREVSRDKLIATLEKLYRFDAGLGAPVTFGPNRRIGARGAFIAAVDLAHHTLGQQISWVDLGS